jgi:pimeloyl-ACP methyl ester carboxylesterase
MERRTILALLDSTLGRKNWERRVELFRTYKADLTIPIYFIESTAPNYVDDITPIPDMPKPFDKYLKNIGWQQALKDIAETLATGTDPNLVVMVHGYNASRRDVLKMYTGAAMALARDPVISRRGGLVCIGYRWPSENISGRGTWDALPALPSWLLYFFCFLTLLPFLYPIGRVASQLLLLAGWTFAGLLFGIVLLRTSAYFSDTYRATNFGVPELVEIIHSIDSEIGKIRQNRVDTNDIQLSFVGHSMGGFVVTNTIRVLTDGFKSDQSQNGTFGAAANREAASNVGRVFQLKRFVLASPDIPAEMLVTSRSNFLAAALARFDEAYLFSNEGDEVLRLISTVANYFVSPTNSKHFLFRLGNLEILSSNFGLIPIGPGGLLSMLRIGALTLQEMHEVLATATALRGQNSPTVDLATQPVLLPAHFTYFDCTDYTDEWTDYSDSSDPIKSERPLLSFAKCYKRKNEMARARWYSHLHLLIVYLTRRRPNVHGGYFEGVLSQQLIYRLACLGYSDTIKSYGTEERLGEICKEKKIRVLISPKLQ